jgi:hypothetical protein
VPRPPTHLGDDFSAFVVCGDFDPPNVIVDDIAQDFLEVCSFD